MFRFFEGWAVGRMGTHLLSERRLHNRARAVWDDLRKDGAFPTPDQFALHSMRELVGHGFLLSLRTQEAPVVVVEAGDVLCEEAGLAKMPAYLTSIPPNSLLGQFASLWEQVVLAREPITSEYEFVTDQSYRILCRGVLLPLASDGQALDHVYGVVSWKSIKLKDKVSES